MNNQYIKMISEAFADPSNITTEKAEAFLKELTTYIADLHAQAASQDPQKKERGLAALSELQAALDAKKKEMITVLTSNLSELSQLNFPKPAITGRKNKNKSKINLVA